MCGYSLPDADMHVKYLLKAAQLNRDSTRERLKITIVNSFESKPISQSEEEFHRYARFFGYNAVRDASLPFEAFAADPGAVPGQASRLERGHIVATEWRVQLLPSQQILPK
jgi:hypothetical protein